VPPVTWYALDAAGNTLETCEAEDIQRARLIFSACCRAAAFIQSKPSYEESRRIAGIPTRRRVEEDEG